MKDKPKMVEVRADSLEAMAESLARIAASFTINLFRAI